MFIHLLRDIGEFLVRMEDSDLFCFLSLCSIRVNIVLSSVGFNLDFPPATQMLRCRYNLSFFVFISVFPMIYLLDRTNPELMRCQKRWPLDMWGFSFLWTHCDAFLLSRAKEASLLFDKMFSVF